MGTYISIPYVMRRSVHVEQSNPVTVQTTKVDSIPEEEQRKDDVKEEPKVEAKEEVKEEVKEEPKVEAKEEVKEDIKENEIVEAEVVIPELLSKKLSIMIPSERESLPDLSENIPEVPRIPEFRGNMNSESHAIKKFNRRHRKHQQH